MHEEWGYRFILSQLRNRYLGRPWVLLSVQMNRQFRSFISFLEKCLPKHYEINIFEGSRPLIGLNEKNEFVKFRSKIVSQKYSQCLLNLDIF